MRGVALAMLAAPAMSLAQPVAVPPAPSQTVQAKRPNVIVILVDDMGFSDVGAYGGEIPTPNIDALAASGIRFTQFYNSARCSPSRAALLTGLYPHEAGMGNLEGVIRPGAGGLQGRIADRAVTIAEVLKPAGYFTGVAGKWHLGTAQGTPPEAVGFERSFYPRGGTYFPDQAGREFVTIDGVRKRLDSPEVGEGEWYASDLLVDWTIKYVDEAKAQKKPFFLYLPLTAVHFPVMAPADEIAKFKGKYMAGWEQLRRGRFERQKVSGLIDAAAQLPDMLPENYDWDDLSAADKERFDTLMAVYAAAISRMDKAIGDLVADLEARGERDNTLILFMSDNGGNAESGPDGRTGKAPWGGPQSNVWVGLNWATLQNTPFSYFKHYAEEGGIATPMIASWPAGIDARVRGTMVREPGHLIDIMPTIAALAGAVYPARHNGHNIRQMSGRSFAPAFAGEPLTRSTPIFWEHEGNKAVRDGKWKLVARFGEPWRLYDMEVDRTELRDVAAAHPDIAAGLANQWDAWAASSFVAPWPNKVEGGVINGALEGGKPQGSRPQGRRGKRGVPTEEAE
ncbi:arylsulfatase [Sphingopyxis sp.]|uniref:arylsulfatase n=1 Tax=Sphingopyxis sp. TaxID=1908224 RepID=UPI003F72881C